MPDARTYRRVSDDEQVLGYSLDDQKERCRDYCRAQGWTIAGEYADEGISAKDMRRPGLRQLLADLQRGDVVVTLKLDRLTRSVPDFYHLMAQWDETGIAYRSVLEPIDTTHAAGRMNLGLLALLAQWYREQLSENVSRGLLRKARNGKRPNGRAPKFGYTFTDNGPTINEEQAAMIRRVEELYLGGHGIRAVCHLTGLNAHTVIRIIGDHQYTGLLMYNTTQRRGTRQTRRPEEEWVRIEGGLPAIRTPERQAELDAVRAAKQAFGKRAGISGRAVSSPYLLTGLLKCGLCGWSMVRLRPRHRDGRTERARYHCGQWQHHKRCCSNSVAAEPLEEKVLSLMLSEATQLSLAARVHRQTRRHTATAALEAAIERLQDAYESGRLTKEAFDKRYDARAEELRNLQAAPPPVDEAAIHALADESRRNLRHLLDGNDTAAVKAYLLAHIEKIVVQSGDATVILRG